MMRRLALALVALICVCRLAWPSPQTTITFCYTSDPSMDVNVPLIREFEALHPDIHVKHLVLPSDVDVMHDRFVTALAAGEADMDCFALDVIWLAEFSNAGWLHPLDEFTGREKLDGFIQSTLAPLRRGGRLYALPWSCSVGTLFYRKDLLARLRIEPPKTWRELIAASDRLRLAFPSEMDDPFVFQGGRYEGLVCDFLEYLWGNGADVFDEQGNVTVSSPQAVEALELMRDLIYRYKVAPRAVTAYQEQDGYLIFTQGRAPFLRSWPYVMRAQNEAGSAVAGKIGLTRVPGRDGPGHGCIGTWNLAVSALSPHPREAWMLIDFLTQKRAQKVYATQSGLNPSLSALYTDPEVVAARPYLPQFLEVIASGRSRPASPLYPKVSSILQIQVHRALAGELSSREALDEAAWKLEALRKRYAGVPLQ